jgi:hypothetical protein
MVDVVSPLRLVPLRGSVSKVEINNGCDKALVHCVFVVREV